jgi:multidrug efflux pump subunit AcrA (membrane-fusion protein)
MSIHQSIALAAYRSGGRPCHSEEDSVRALGWRNGWWSMSMSLAFALAGCGGDGAASDEEGAHEPDGEAHVIVRTEPAKVGALTQTADGLGRCEALPDHIATLTPAVEGHVHALLAVQGDLVKKGQSLVEFDKAVAAADLAEKTATRDGLKKSLVLLKSLPRPEERRANELAVEQAKVAVEQAQAAVERLRPLVVHHDVSQQQLFDAERALKQAEIQQQTAEAQLRAMMIGPRPEGVDEAEGKIKTADALVAFSQAHLDYHSIRSPIDGVLDSLTCHPGQTIAIGAPIGEVVDTRQVFATVWLPPRFIKSVRVGQSARVLTDESPVASGGGTGAPSSDEMPGKVAFVGRVADPQTGNLPVRVLVDNPQARLAIGQSIRVSIVVEEHTAALQVPVAALLDLGEGPVLSVVRDGKSVVLHPELVPSQGGWTEVSGTDLKAGEPVVVDGGYNLPEHTPVRLADAKPAAEAPAAPAPAPTNHAGKTADAESKE